MDIADQYTKYEVALRDLIQQLSQLDLNEADDSLIRAIEWQGQMLAIIDERRRYGSNVEKEAFNRLSGSLNLLALKKLNKTFNDLVYRRGL